MAHTTTRRQTQSRFRRALWCPWSFRGCQGAVTRWASCCVSVKISLVVREIAAIGRSADGLQSCWIRGFSRKQIGANPLTRRPNGLNPWKSDLNALACFGHKQLRIWIYHDLSINGGIPEPTDNSAGNWKKFRETSTDFHQPLLDHGLTSTGRSVDQAMVNHFICWWLNWC